MNALQVEKALQRLRNARRAKVSVWLFKTGQGQYGYGDRVLVYVISLSF